MAKIKEIIEKIEKVAPIETQEEWDNSGWQVFLNNKETKNILVSLNVTENTVEQAIKNNCDLIISHHPVFFQPIRNIKNKAIIKAIQNNIQIYSAHTNFDKAKNGTTKNLVKIFEKPLKLEAFKEINDYVVLTKVQSGVDFESFVATLKKTLNIKTIKISKPCKQIKTIAFCAGAGSSFIKDLSSYNVDCYVTADIKYHEALDCTFMLVDIGHFESEVISLDMIKNIIEMPDINVFIGEEEPLFEMV